MELLEFDQEYDLLDIVNELYVGETKFIEEFIELVSEARAPYKGAFQRAIRGDRNLPRIAEMIEKEFGFAGVSFLVPFDTSLNAFTYPVTMSMDKNLRDTVPKFDKKTGMKHDPVNRLHTIIAVTSGVWFNKDITDREVVAAILHEVGHNFVTHSERLIPLLESVKLAGILITVYNAYIAIIKALAGDMRDITQVVQSMVYSSDVGKQIIITANKYIDSNVLLYGMQNLSETYTAIFMQVLKEISAVMSFKKLTVIPTYLIQSVFKLLLKPFTDSKRSQEYLSDSFASMYGLGPEVTSFLTKIEYDPSPSGSAIEKVINKIPVIGALNESLNIPILLITHTTNDHPSTLARCKKLIDELEKEMKESDLSPATKKAIAKNIEDLEKVKDQLIDTERKFNKNDAATIKAGWFQFLNNQGAFTNSDEDYYTDIRHRNKVMKGVKESTFLDDIELI